MYEDKSGKEFRSGQGEDTGCRVARGLSYIVRGELVCGRGTRGSMGRTSGASLGKTMCNVVGFASSH